MTTRDPIAERFTRETAHHRMTVLHDDGLYRHLHFADANPDPTRRMSWNLWFDLITVPGALIFQGDGESFTFRRTQDMFGFFLGSAWKGEPNYHYWSEKLTNSRDSVMRYSEARFIDEVKRAFIEDVRNRDVPPGTGKALIEHFETVDHLFESEARDALDSFEYKGYGFHDTWEWDFREYDWWYRWACNAIVWGVAQYRAGCTGPREDHPAAEEPLPAPAVIPAPKVVTVEVAGGVL